MKTLFLILSLIFCSNLIANDSKHDEAVRQTRLNIAEGEALYKTEMASWYGTDIIMQKLEDKNKIGGYFSYTENDKTKCIFFSRSNNPQVISCVTFDSTYNTKNALVEMKEREFTNIENQLFQMRKKVMSIITIDTIFKYYEKTSYNLIPLIRNGEKKVYILTGHHDPNMIVLGNDYLITFDDNLNIVSSKKLHNSIITISYGKNKEFKETNTVHTHNPETGDCITATDVCTLKLYDKFTTWESHIIMGPNFTTFFGVKKPGWSILPNEIMEKIAKEKKETKEKKEADEKSK